jgi:hypothetical protein
MSQIVLTEEQMQVVRQSTAPVNVCDSNGLVLGTVDPQITPEFVAEMKRRARGPGPWWTGEQVRNHLRALQEAWDREGPFDQARMRELLERIRAADTPYQAP